MRKKLLFFGFFFSAALANAQDSTKAEISLNEVTVVATKFTADKRNISQQVVTVNANKISSYNQQTTAELLTHTGSVLVQKSQLGGGSPVLRGFEANKILLVVDGVRMNNAIYRGGHLQNVITLDQNMLEKAEVLFGPSSVIYGSDALGGVIGFYTKKPALSTGSKTILSGNAFTRYASAYNEKTGHVDINIGGKKLASLTSFTFSDFGDLTQGGSYYSKFPLWGKRTFYVQRINGADSMIKNSDVNKQLQTDYKQYDILQKFLFKTGNTEHILNFQYSTSSDIYRYDRLTETNSAGVAKSAEWYYGPQKRLLASWAINLQQSNLYDKAQVTVAYQNIEESRHNRNYKSTKLNHRIEKLNIVSLNADFTKKINGLQLGYGAEVTYNKVSSSAYAENITTGERSSLDTRYPDGGSNTQSYAVYTTGQYKISDKILATGGLRYGHNRLYSKFIDKTFFPFPYNDIEQTSSSLTGNAGLIIAPAEGWKISMLVSTGFRTPNVDDMTKVFESGNGTLIVPNPKIKPEKTINYELGIAKIINNKLRVGVAAWYTNYHDALGVDFSTFNGSSTILYDRTLSKVVRVVNKNAAYVYGLSADVLTVLNNHFFVSSVINYTYGRIKEEPENYPLDHVAPLFGKTSLMATFGKFKGEIFALYNGAKDSANYNLRGEDNQIYSADVTRGYTPSWVIFNVRTDYAINKNITMQFAIENIFDKYYKTFASGLGAPGRNFVITLRSKL